MRSYKCNEQSFNNISISVYEGTFDKTQNLVAFSHSMSNVTCKLQFIVNPDSQCQTCGNPDKMTVIVILVIVVKL